MVRILNVELKTSENFALRLRCFVYFANYQGRPICGVEDLYVSNNKVYTLPLSSVESSSVVSQTIHFVYESNFFFVIML